MTFDLDEDEAKLAELAKLFRADLNAAKQADKEARTADPVGYFCRKLQAAYDNPAHGCSIGSDAYHSCATAMKAGLVLPPDALALFLRSMSNTLRTSDEVLALIDDQAMAQITVTSASCAVDMLRSLANLRRAASPLFGAYGAGFVAASALPYEDRVGLLWAHAVIGSDVGLMFGRDALLEPNRGQVFSKALLRELLDLHLAAGLPVNPEVVSEFERLMARPPILCGSQSPMEDQVARILTELGLPFTQQTGVGAYSPDFIVDVNGERVIVEALGQNFHFLSTIPPLSGSGFGRLVPTSVLRGIDCIRFRVFAALGYRTVAADPSTLSGRRPERIEKLRAKLFTSS